MSILTRITSGLQTRHFQLLIIINHEHSATTNIHGSFSKCSCSLSLSLSLILSHSLSLSEALTLILLPLPPFSSFLFFFLPLGSTPFSLLFPLLGQRLFFSRRLDLRPFYRTRREEGEEEGQGEEELFSHNFFRVNFSVRQQFFCQLPSFHPSHLFPSFSLLFPSFFSLRLIHSHLVTIE